MACSVESLQKIMDETKPPKVVLSPELSSVAKVFQESGQMTDEIKKIVNRIYENREISADEVYPGIYLGNIFAAQDIDFLKSHGIGYVLNCAQATGTGYDRETADEEFYRGSGIKSMGLNILDNNDADIFGHLDSSFHFIDTAIENSDKILIHCTMGISRSAVITIAYLMSRKQLTVAEAVKTVRQKRDIHPNAGFLQQLCQLDEKLRKC